MKKTLCCLILWLVGALSASAGTRVIPIAGHVPGANGSSWTTDVSITNNDATAADVQLIFHSDFGTVSRTVHIAAGSSLLLDDAVRPDQFPGTNPASWMGQLEVRSARNISASARTFTAAIKGGTYGSAYESYDPAVLSSEGAIAGLVQSARYRSNVAYANATDSMAVVSYNLRGEDGTLLANNLLIVPAHSTVQPSLSRDLAPSPTDSRIQIEWTSTVPMYVIASVVDNLSNDPTNIPSANSATELFFPIVGRTAGAQSTQWSTSASISSRADIAGNVTFAYRDSGNGQLYTKTVPVGPRGTIHANDVNLFVGAGAGSGSLTVSSTVRIVSTVRLFNTSGDGSTYGSALLPQVSAVRAPQIVIKGVRRDDDYRLNISLSGHTSATDGTVRLRDDNGQEVESEAFHLESGKMLQVALNRGTTQIRSGEVEVETHNGVSISAVASSIDNRTGDTSVREAEQENERQRELEVRITPSTASIGAPVSFTIGSGNGVASVRWTFGDGTTGSGINTSHTYTRSGEFKATAEVTLTSGAIVRDQEDVHVLSNGSTGGSNGPIDFSWSPIAPAPGEQVTFTASRTSNGGSFKWKFPGNVRINGSVAAFTFPTSGSYEVELELEHEGNTTLHANHTVTVGGSPNSGGGGALDFTWSPANPAAGEAITFTASGGNGGTFIFKFPGNIRKAGSVVTHTFANAGSYEVELEQEHGSTPTLHASHVVNVGGGSNGGNGGTPTSVDFSWSPSSPRAGQTVTFTATSDKDLPAGASFKWRMPDNSRPQGKTATYTFNNAGTYKIRVEIEHGGVDVERERNIVIAP